ncbi:MAG: hypothetical protein GSR72_00165, partial [Desulfurococcales archaeon]|nr:hypothetical protein [Desulfurococcales archaeon]
YHLQITQRLENKLTLPLGVGLLLVLHHLTEVALAIYPGVVEEQVEAIIHGNQVANQVAQAIRTAATHQEVMVGGDGES